METPSSCGFGLCNNDPYLPLVIAEFGKTPIYIYVCKKHYKVVCDKRVFYQNLQIKKPLSKPGRTSGSVKSLSSRKDSRTKGAVNFYPCHSDCNCPDCIETSKREELAK